MLISKRSLVLGAGAAFIAPRAASAYPAPILLINPLAFPGGTPGVNTAHPAAGANLRYSAVASGGRIINLLSGAIPTLHSTITSAVDGVGPVIVNTTSTAYLSTTGINDVTPSSVTFGAIFNLTAANAAFNILFSNNNGNASSVDTWFYINASRVPGIVAGGSGVVATGTTLTVGIPYFIGLSYNGSTVSAVIRNLLSGVITSASASGVHTIGTQTQGVYNIGGIATASRHMNGRLAAIMYSVNVYLSTAQLQVWAKAPWEFWYPPKTNDVMAHPAISPPANTARLRTLTGLGQ